MDGAGSQKVCSDLSTFKAQRAFGIAGTLTNTTTSTSRYHHRQASDQLTARGRVPMPTAGPARATIRVTAATSSGRFFSINSSARTAKTSNFRTIQPVRRQA